MPLSFFLIFLVFTFFIIPFSKADLSLGYDDSGQPELVNVTNLNLGYNEAKVYGVNLISGNGTIGNGTDEKVKVSENDTFSTFLWYKLFAGSGITLSVLNVGGNEQIRIDSTGGGNGSGGSWFNNTVFQYDGDMDGYVIADTACDLEFPGTHFCTFDEIKRTIENGDVGTFPNGDNAWFSNGPPGYTANANDCYGWTESNTTYLGPFWLFDNTRGGEGWLTNCGQVKSLACCK